MCAGLPSGARAWKCTMLAPASRQRAALSAISSGVHGTFGFSSRIAYSLMRASRMSFFIAQASLPVVCSSSAHSSSPKVCFHCV